MWLIFAVVSFLAISACAAPTTDPKPLKLREFMQGEEPIGGASVKKAANTKPVDYEDYWYPTMELPSNDDYKLPKLPAKNKTKVTSKKICEHKEPVHLCNDHHDDTIEGILKKIRDIIEKENELKENKVKELRQLVSKLTVKIHELENKAKSCGNAKNKSISEVEIKHIVDRKLIKTNEHMEESHDHDASSSSHQTAVAQPSPSTPNYLQRVTPEVNFNGGINKPMDELKIMYPNGHWPDQDDSGSSNSDASSYNPGNQNGGAPYDNPNNYYNNGIQPQQGTMDNSGQNTWQQSQEGTNVVEYFQNHGLQ